MRLEDSGAEARKANLRDAWSTWMTPVVQPGEADFEEFYEEAARLDAAVFAFGEDRVWVSQYRDETARNLGTGETVPLTAVQHLRRYGGQPSTRQTGLPQLTRERSIDRYDRFEAFTRNAGRPVVLAGHDLDGAPGLELYDVVRNLAEQGFPKVVVKVTKAKHGFAIIDVHRDISDEDLSDTLLDVLDWALVRASGRPEAFLVQGFVPMRFEYRMFVVDGRVVTGGACIEEFTPAQNLGDAFDTRVREHRMVKSPVVDRPDVVSRLLTFAEQVVAEWLVERPDLRTAVIDVALDPDGNPLVVEFNGLLNAGLYASDPRLVTAALEASPALPALDDPTGFIVRATPANPGFRLLP